MSDVRRFEPHKMTVEVDTETGERVVVDLMRDTTLDTYTLSLSGVLLDQSPEAITAAVQLVMIELANWRHLERHP